MLPLRINLDEKIRICLRSQRLNAIVDGKTLTAEQLSLAIGKNRAWMSQIESGRLKTIRREDIISLYKYLFDLNDEDAEKKAENDFSINLDMSDDLVLITSNYKDEEFEKEKENNLSISFKRVIGLIHQNCIKIFNNLSIEQQKDFINSLGILEHSIRKNHEDSMKLISVPLFLLSTIDYQDKKDILDDIDNITEKCRRYIGQLKIKQYYDEKERFHLLVNQFNSCKTKDETQISELGLSISTTFLTLTSLFIYENKSIETNIKLMNDYINLLLKYQTFIPKKYQSYIDFLDESARENDLKVKIDQIQNYLVNISHAPIKIYGNLSDEIE